MLLIRRGDSRIARRRNSIIIEYSHRTTDRVGLGLAPAAKLNIKLTAGVNPRPTQIFLKKLYGVVMRKEEYIATAVSKITNKKAKRETEKELAAHIDELIDRYVNSGYTAIWATAKRFHRKWESFIRVQAV